MLLFRLTVSMIVVLALQACAGKASVIDQAGQQSLQSLQLFNADSSPRFAFYLACTSADDGSCVIAEKIFSAWADDRHVHLRSIEPGDVMFTRGFPSSERNAGLPYRVAVRFEPQIMPSFDESSLDPSGALVGSYTPPKVGYNATIYVFDSTTGKLLQRLPAHEQRSAKYKENVNGYIRSLVGRFIASLDPAYSLK